MKKKSVFAAMMFGGLFMFAGCDKDNFENNLPEGAMLLLSENQSADGAKMSVSALSVQWTSGDVVTIDGNDYTVAFKSNRAYTSTAVPEASCHYGYYNCGPITNGQTTTPTVTIPSRYESSYNSGGRQIIQLPLAAYSNRNSRSITFMHLTAALEVIVTNSTGFDDLYIDSVQVISATQNLCGSVDLNFTKSNYNLTYHNGSNNTVTVYFGWQEVTLDNGDSLKVQVPILPIAQKTNDITVKVYTHHKAPIVLNKPGMAPANYDFIYSRTKSFPSMSRNQMLKVDATVTRHADNALTTEVDHSLFSVSATKQVHFSQGNLQRNKVQSGNILVWQWSFHERQYDLIGSSSGNLKATDSEPWISDGLRFDLFGWSTTATYYGVRRSTTNADYIGDFVDWGTLDITNGGGSNKWRTLASDGTIASEWVYLTAYTRPNKTSKATLQDVPGYEVNKTYNRKGFIILPDYWTLPSDCSFTPDATNFTTNEYTVDQWTKMEAAGAVFLPAAGYREGRTVQESGTAGYYWSSSLYPYATNTARGIAFWENGASLTGGYGFAQGQAVRLVCD